SKLRAVLGRRVPNLSIFWQTLCAGVAGAFSGSRDSAVCNPTSYLPEGTRYMLPNSRDRRKVAVIGWYHSSRKRYSRRKRLPKTVLAEWSRWQSLPHHELQLRLLMKSSDSLSSMRRM